MCGIFGLVTGSNAHVTPPQLFEAANILFRLSESRGKEAAGFAARAGDQLTVYKAPFSASRMLRTPAYRTAFTRAFAAAPASGNGGPAGAALIGHSRLVTNGMQALNENNQPVVKAGLVGVHNGIVVNDAELWRAFPGLSRQFDVDTEVILALLRAYLDEHGSVAQAACHTFERLRGAATIAVLRQDADDLLLATNTGSLYACENPALPMLLFTSERYILEEAVKRQPLHAWFRSSPIHQIEHGQARSVDIPACRVHAFALEPVVAEAVPPRCAPRNGRARLLNLSESEEARRARLRRCTRCVLPETMPFIAFDDAGVCNFCRRYTTLLHTKGADALDEILRAHRSAAGDPDCIVAFSGGRDSSYGLHLLRTEFGMHPITFTYDWGMVTDLARRNQARMCGALGVEHILISADIQRKRANIRKNVEAWLKRPELGMIPLFMAGDKQFFYYANRLREQLRIPLVIFCVNPLERTSFKTGFCGVDEGASTMYFNMGMAQKAQLSGYYLRQYLRNPRYLNASLLDTLWSYASSFLIPHDWLSLFEYVDWNEREIERVLLNEYDWETAPDTRSTWRIGDGTAAFYNYVYYTVAGFTENDTFRSNQIREGRLTRDQALTLVQEENQARFASLQWYAQTIGIDLNWALSIIHAIPKRY